MTCFFLESKPKKKSIYLLEVAALFQKVSSKDLTNYTTLMTYPVKECIYIYMFNHHITLCQFVAKFMSEMIYLFVLVCPLGENKLWIWNEEKTMRCGWRVLVFLFSQDVKWIEIKKNERQMWEMFVRKKNHIKYWIGYNNYCCWCCCCCCLMQILAWMCEWVCKNFHIIQYKYVFI